MDSESKRRSSMLVRGRLPSIGEGKVRGALEAVGARGSIAQAGLTTEIAVTMSTHTATQQS